jgi:hypothetical protein
MELTKDEQIRIRALELAQAYIEIRKKRELSLDNDIIAYADHIVKFIQTGDCSAPLDKGASV